jgi:hypothetical protein
MVWLAPSPGHRRLRFSFQINDVKDLLGAYQVHRCARWRRGGASLNARPESVNRFTNKSKKAWMRAQKSPRGRRGLPHQSFSESVEGAEVSPATSEKQELFRFLGLSEARCWLPNREGRRITGRRPSCKRHTLVAAHKFGDFVSPAAARRRDGVKPRGYRRVILRLQPPSRRSCSSLGRRSR